MPSHFGLGLRNTSVPAQARFPSFDSSFRRADLPKTKGVLIGEVTLGENGASTASGFDFRGKLRYPCREPRLAAASADDRGERRALRLLLCSAWGARTERMPARGPCLCSEPGSLCPAGLLALGSGL
jgi:hypothetical protein